MAELLNRNRPPAFCPGCSHQRVVHALAWALESMGLAADQTVIVSDIGCSGLFDTFFNTHALHGLHGRALTYATGIKMARPELKVIVTMGDGGLGIGGAHVLSTCRRNIDLTLLVLNNFNYGMTGGQCSPTTPSDARVASGFLNRLEKPVDICQVAAAAGAGFAARLSAYDDNLAAGLTQAIGYDGFSLVDIRGICTGRYTKRNKLTPRAIAAAIDELPPLDALLAENQRSEYSRAYRREAAQLAPVGPPAAIEPSAESPLRDRCEVLLLGSAGQRIITAGQLFCLAGVAAGLHATQKNDYPITVMRGHSITEIILSRTAIGYTGIENPAVIVALGQEGIERRKALFAQLSPATTIVAGEDVELPAINAPASVRRLDFKALKIRSQDRAMASLAWLASQNLALTPEMLTTAVKIRFRGEVLDGIMRLVHRMWAQC